MSSAMVIRYTTRPEVADENAQLVEKVFAELAVTQPAGLHYATFRMADGVTFMHLLVSEGEGNALGQTAAFADFQKGSADRCVEPPTFTQVTVVGSYGFGDL